MATLNYGPCEACWTISWEPVPEEAQCALQHPHEGEHVQCEYCELLKGYEGLQQRLYQVREFALDLQQHHPDISVSPIVQLTESDERKGS